MEPVLCRPTVPTLVLAMALVVSGLVGCGRSGGAAAGEPGRATVVRVVDGDTIVVAIGGVDERVRLIGIDTPESVDPRSPVDCFGPEASGAARALLPEGTEVQLVRDVEARRRGPSYTVETVREMRSSEPDIDITLVLGRDAAALLPTWHRSEELLAEVSLALVDRPGAEIVAGPVGADDAALLVPMPQIGVSSSEIRRRVADGRPITVLVPAAVAELIERHGLYRA